MKKQHITCAAMVVALALPATAGAHVTLQPESAPAGAYVVENVRVPNERDDASTVKIQLALPDGFAGASTEPIPGWTAEVTKTKLATPVKTDDGEITEQVSRIVWTANSKADGIGPGEFRDFPISVKVPGKEGDSLTFKAIQTYSSGEVVRWIGAADSDNPAPVVSVTAVTGDHGDAAVAAVTEEDAADESDGASKGLGIAALIVGALGLVAGVAAIMLARRK